MALRRTPKHGDNTGLPAAAPLAIIAICCTDRITQYFPSPHLLHCQLNIAQIPFVMPERDFIGVPCILYGDGNTGYLSIFRVYFGLIAVCKRLSTDKPIRQFCRASWCLARINAQRNPDPRGRCLLSRGDSFHYNQVLCPR